MLRLAPNARSCARPLVPVSRDLLGIRWGWLRGIAAKNVAKCMWEGCLHCIFMQIWRLMFA